MTGTTIGRSFRDAVESRDLDAMMACFDDGVVFHSPVAHRPFVGRDAVRQVLGAVLTTFEDFRYVDEAHATRRSTPWFEARVGDRRFEGVDVLHHGADDRVASALTVMIRPRSGLDAVAAAIAARLMSDAEVMS